MTDTHPYRPSPYAINNECRDCGEYEEDGPHVDAEEYPDHTIRQNGPIVIGQRCPWCGAMVTDAEHSRGHD